MANGVAHESKVGYTTLTKFIRKQVLKDYLLVKRSGKVDKAVWHFYRSARTGKIGLSKPLYNYLRSHGIDVIIHQ